MKYDNPVWDDLAGYGLSLDIRIAPEDLDEKGIMCAVCNRSMADQEVVAVTDPPERLLNYLYNLTNKLRAVKFNDENAIMGHRLCIEKVIDNCYQENKE